MVSSLDIRGNILRMTKRWDQSIALFQKASGLNKKIGNERGAARNLANIATVYSIMKQFDNSLPFFQEAIELSQKLNDRFLEAFAYGNMGMNYVELNRPEEAEASLNKAIELYRSMNNKFRVLRTTSQISRLHMSQGNFQKAIDILAPAYEESLELTDIKLTDDLVFNLGDSYEGIGNYKKALLYHRKHMALQDSMLNEQVTNAVNDAEAKYENEKKVAEIERLALEDQLSKTRISRQRLALGGSIGGLGILSFLLFRIFGQKQKIESQNELISKALAEKDTLLREIHHRVKNNLQVISSLLRIQSNQTKDEIAIDALKEGQARVQSMSLIHQDLYQKENLTGVRMKVYLERLTQNLFSTYNISKDRIQLKMSIVDLNLDVDTVVPLGLIINELVTNSLKYAFPNDRSGTVSVSLVESIDSLILKIEDDGIGINSSNSVLTEGSFGYNLIQAFAHKLEAEIIIDGSEGTRVQLDISNFQKV